MIKKLDKLILRAFIGPFAATFFITLLVLVMQFFWLYIDDFVGKGLSAAVIGKFILYQGAVLVPLALPLAILLSSIMTFGNLGESFELVAIKSAGISLLRFMRPLLVFTVLVCGLAFLFSNNIIPVANLKSRTMLSDIVYAKPAFDLKEGVFYDKINGYAIKIGKKESNDSVIRDVVVFEQGNLLQDNFLIADSGVMRVTPDKRFLIFNLKNGWRNQERGNSYIDSTGEFIRIGFKEYNKMFDLTAFQMTWTPDSANRNNEKMYTMRQLDHAIDSLRKDIGVTRQSLMNDLFRLNRFPRLIDSEWQDTGKAVIHPPLTGNLIPDSALTLINQRVQSQASSVKISAESLEATLKDKEKIFRRHEIEWHRKITLSLACLVLFLIGAPLGSIIRKGGLGMPLILAIVFFLLFYFSSNTGEKFAKEGSMSPFMGMWLATFILVPLGLFLTYKAMRDSNLFRKDFYTRIVSFFNRKKT